MNGAGKFKVDKFSGSKRVVDLVAQTCSCRTWDLTGIPSTHAISAIYAKERCQRIVSTIVIRKKLSCQCIWL